MMEALGMVETRGMAALVEASDAILKAANVKFVGYEKLGDGIVIIMVRGSVADCRIGVDAAVAAAAKIGQVLKGNVIPYPYEDLEGKLPIKIKN
jgi:ethanolamine utilization protein EutM